MVITIISGREEGLGACKIVGFKLDTGYNGISYYMSLLWTFWYL